MNASVLYLNNFVNKGFCKAKKFNSSRSRAAVRAKGGIRALVGEEVAR